MPIGLGFELQPGAGAGQGVAREAVLTSQQAQFNFLHRKLARLVFYIFLKQLDEQEQLNVACTPLALCYAVVKVDGAEINLKD